MKFLYRRILTYVVVLIAVLNLTFFLPRFAPGNAADILAGGTRVPAEAAKLIAVRFGLDQPLPIQYVDFLKNIFLTWPPYFGVSYGYYPAQVTQLFAVRIVWSLLLILASIAVGELMTYFVSAFASIRRAGKFEVGSLYSSIMLNSMPLFWLAMIFLYVFSIELKWFPLFGSTGFHAGTGVQFYLNVMWHAVLPVIVLSLSLFGESFLILRGSIQDVLKSDYVLAAKSRGVSNWVLSSRYILRNSLLPLVAVISFSMASLISRVVLVEVIFGYPGIGDFIIDAIIARDYPVLEGSLFYTTIIVIIGGIIGDLLLVRLDPRLKK
ncbi:MAG: ABC transporter permease [Nitrososphaerales archaeon]